MIITIYQAKNPTFRVNETVEEYIREDYNKVYEMSVTREACSDHDILESVFEQFNIRRPADFMGWSMSVGDIVILDNEAYICCSCGWKKIKFVGKEQ